MIGVLIVTHGTIGEALLASATQILGVEQRQVATLGVSRSDDPDLVLPRARALIGELDRGHGVLVLADMYGATPCNIVARLLADGKVEGIAGISLPMLVRVLSGRNGSLADAVARARSGGAEGVVHMNRDRCNGSG
jgi:PTS system ascorbate-specific IIA component